MQRIFGHFLVRWFVTTLGLWIAAGLLGDRITYGGRIMVLVVAGLILAMVNAIIKPIIVILSLPAVLLTLGLFMIIINGFMVWLVSVVYSSFAVSGFGSAILAGIVIGLVNYLVSAILEAK